MRSVIVTLCVGLVAPQLWAQAPSPQDSALARDAILALSRDINTAIARKDRAALERVFAPEFMIVHAYGYVLSRAEHIDELMARDSADLLPVPTFESPSQLLLYGDVAMHVLQSSTTTGTPALSTRTYAKRDGRWQVVRIQSTEMQPQRVAVHVAGTLLERYVGRYDRGNGQFVVIEREGDALFRLLPGLPRVRLVPVSSSRFFDRIGAEWKFEPAAPKSALQVRYRFRDRSWRAEKIGVNHR